MSRIHYVRLTMTDNNGRAIPNNYFYIKRDDIDHIATNDARRTGVPGITYIRAKGQNYYVAETPEEVVALVNEIRFGQQQVR